MEYELAFCHVLTDKEGDNYYAKRIQTYDMGRAVLQRFTLREWRKYVITTQPQHTVVSNRHAVYK